MIRTRRRWAHASLLLACAGALISAGASRPASSGPPPTATLQLIVQGLGNVTVEPAGVDRRSGATVGTCSELCELTFPRGSEVVLTGVPIIQGEFRRWSVFECESANPCPFALDRDTRSVVAFFFPEVGHAPPPPPPPPVGEDGEPNANETVVVEKLSGSVRVRLPGTARDVGLGDARRNEVPNGTRIDARTGRFKLVVAAAGGATSSAVFSGGVASIGQYAPGRPGVAELRLAGGVFGARCREARSTRASPSPRRPVRALWGSGRGRFRTRGRFATATVRSSTWLTEDYCNGTLVRASRGAATVRDLARRKTFAVEAGERYFAFATGPPPLVPAPPPAPPRVAPPPPIEITLTFEVRKGGTGTGTVTGEGLSCGQTCARAYPLYTLHEFAAEADAGSAFVRWVPDCSGRSRGICRIAIGEITSLQAIFSKAGR